jgi:hypothetical protein
VLAPGQWVVIPLFSCYFRLDPTGEALDIKYFGDYYDPKAITYTSAVSGSHRIPLNLEDIPQTSTAFNEPPLPETEETEDSRGSDPSYDDNRSKNLDQERNTREY